MSLVADGLMIVTCLTAALYCFVLSRRLRQLSDTGSGVGQQVVQMNAALEEIRSALKETRENAQTASERLTRDVAQAKKHEAQLKDLMARAEALSVELHRAPPARAAPAAEAEAAPAPRRPDPAADASPVVEDTAEDAVVDAAAEETVGEQQLGFLPDLEDMEDETPSETEAGEAVEPGGFRAAPPAEGGEKVMQVERMGL